MRIILFSFTLLILGCSNNQIPYKKAEIDYYIEFANSGDTGYFEEEKSVGIWRLKYIGLPTTPYEQLKSLLNKRAYELCKNGYSSSNYIQTGSVVAHREPSINRYVEAVIKCNA
jgi:hypothetical protein